MKASYEKKIFDLRNDNISMNKLLKQNYDFLNGCVY